MTIERFIVLAIAVIIIAHGIIKARRALKSPANGCDSGGCGSCGKICPVKGLKDFSPQKKPPKKQPPSP